MGVNFYLKKKNGKRKGPIHVGKLILNRNMIFKYKKIVNMFPVEAQADLNELTQFTWAVNPQMVTDSCEIVDEYSNFFTGRDFRNKVLSLCPEQYFHLVGIQFS